MFFFAGPAGDRRFLPDAMPGWADFNEGDIFYGFPSLEARGVKFEGDGGWIFVAMSGIVTSVYVSLQPWQYFPNSARMPATIGIVDFT